MIPQVPFAETSGGVSPRFTKFREGRFLTPDPGSAARPEGTVYTDAIGITSREKPGAGRRANWLGCIPVRKLPSLRGHLVEVWCRKSLGPKDSDVLVSLIIGKDDYDIGWSFFGGSPGEEHRKYGEEKESLHSPS